MKQYVTSNQLRIIGKGWEIRGQLAKLSAEASGTALIADFTQSLPPIKIAFGSSAGKGSG